MIVKEFDFSIEDGLAWIVLEDGETVQCCLKSDDNGVCEKLIIRHDCGHDWGICGDVNATSFEKWGENRCMKLLFRYAQNNGIKVV